MAHFSLHPLKGDAAALASPLILLEISFRPLSLVSHWLAGFFSTSDLETATTAQEPVEFLMRRAFGRRASGRRFQSSL
jgi:hypothetical protein